MEDNWDTLDSDSKMTSQERATMSGSRKKPFDTDRQDVHDKVEDEDEETEGILTPRTNESEMETPSKFERNDDIDENKPWQSTERPDVVGDGRQGKSDTFSGASETSRLSYESSVNPGHSQSRRDDWKQLEPEQRVACDASLDDKNRARNAVDFTQDSGQDLPLEYRPTYDNTQQFDKPSLTYQAPDSVEEPADDMSAQIPISASGTDAYLGGSEHGSALTSGPGFGNKTAPGGEDVDTSTTRFGTAADTSTYSGGTHYGSGTTAGPGVGNKAPPGFGQSEESESKDSTLGKVLEKAGGLLKNDSLAEKGREKREEN